MIGQAALCDICESVLATEGRIYQPHLQVALGIHPEAFREWKSPMPVMWRQFHYCLRYGLYDLLANRIAMIAGIIIDGKDMPDYQEGLGHFITATEILPKGNGGFFNIQLSKEEFINFLITFPIFAHGLFSGWRK